MCVLQRRSHILDAYCKLFSDLLVTHARRRVTHNHVDWHAGPFDHGLAETDCRIHGDAIGNFNGHEQRLRTRVRASLVNYSTPRVRSQPREIPACCLAVVLRHKGSAKSTILHGLNNPICCSRASNPGAASSRVAVLVSHSPYPAPPAGPAPPHATAAASNKPKLVPTMPPSNARKTAEAASTGPLFRRTNLRTRYHALRRVWAACDHSRSRKTTKSHRRSLRWLDAEPILHFIHARLQSDELLDHASTRLGGHHSFHNNCMTVMSDRQFGREPSEILQTCDDSVPNHCGVCGRRSG